VTVFVVTCLVNSTYGRGFIAVHDDEVAASGHGHQSVRYKVTAFVIGAFFRRHRGRLYAHHKQVLSPDGFRFHEVHRHRRDGHPRRHGPHGGVIIAAILLTLLPEVLRGFADYRMIIYSLLIIGLMMRVRRVCSLSAKKRTKHERALLKLDKVTIRFGGLTAVSEVDLQIGAHELVGLIGPNGAGKTTLFNLITGVYQPTGGAITFNNGQPSRRVEAV
jgi:ABC-type multidrug transport system fused ATPase/permease subunit